MTGHSITRKACKRKGTSGNVKTFYRKGKNAKYECALCGENLKGVPDSRNSIGVRKKSKTEKRPNGIFGGVLCGNCRQKVIIDAAFVKMGDKKIEDVSANSKKFVEEAVRKVC